MRKGDLGVWLFTIGLFWAAFKRESGSCLGLRVSGCTGDVGRLVGLYHLGGLGKDTMKEGVRVTSPTRDRTVAFPSVPSLSTPVLDVCE